MVGLSDIPCVGKALDKISEATVEATFRGLHYMFCYKDLAVTLNSEIEKVNIQEGRVSKKSADERADGKTIEVHVLKWQKEVEEIQATAKEFSGKYNNTNSWRCVQCLPIPKPVSRFRLGREAAHMAKSAAELTHSGKELLANKISYLSPVQNLPKTDNEFQIFQSRNDAYLKLWEALVTEGSCMILGIYGMPGVGKTRMTEQIWEDVKEKKIFDKVTRGDVGSEKLDVIKLQNQIAGHLGCNFESQDDVDRRASQLKNSLMNGRKNLIILDDVWREIPLGVIGIPHEDGSSSCKILFTSREKNVCLRNNCKYPVKISTLTAEEAWDLFRNTVGTSQIESLQDESLARKVCDKCAFLPLLIHAVGKALQFMSHNSWMDALDQLDKGKIENIAGIDPQVYACVELSISRLLDDAKSCLFLCSLFPEDADIHVRILIELATGSQLVHGGRLRVRAMVDVLKSSSLLLESKKAEHVKLHDLIRDVARSVAETQPKYAFLFVRCGAWLPDNINYATRKLLRLDVESDDVRFPEDLVCPNLNNLWLQCDNHLQQLSGGFFSMFVNLGFLMFQNMQFSSMPVSLQPLSKLKTLILDNCAIGKTDAGFFPDNIRTLSIRDCNHASPLDLSTLKYLRKLQISARPRVVLVPNCISSLSSLEELDIPYGFIFADDASNRPARDEISELTRLTSLRIHFDEYEFCQGKAIFFHLLEYHVSVGWNQNNEAFGVTTTRLIELTGHHIEGFESLMERAEEVRLTKTDAKLSSGPISNKEAFADLRKLYIEDSDKMEYIARISQDEIQPSHQPWTSFTKLTILKIEDCSRMEFLFCNTVAKCLVQLQDLHVRRCRGMKTVVMDQGTSDREVINFPKLKELRLSLMHSLTSFYGGKKEMQWNSTSTSDNSAIASVQFQPFFDGMVTFPLLEILELHCLRNTSDIWGKHYSNDNESFCQIKRLMVASCEDLETVIPLAMLHKLQNLEYVLVWNCDNLRNVFQHSSVATALIHLETLNVERCKMIREMIGRGEKDITHGTIVFPELMALNLNGLPNFTSFWCDWNGEEAKVEFPSLVQCAVQCGKINLDTMGLGRNDSACQLMSLNIRCYEEIQFPCTWKLRLCNLESVTLRNCWWHEPIALCLPKLKVLKLDNSGCSTLFTFSALESLQQLEEIEIFNCPALEEIGVDARGDGLSGVDKHTITLFQLKSVVLKDLPNLTSFVHAANYECHMPALVDVRVDNCGLSTLFTCSVFGNLRQLKKLKVSNCRLLEDIVEDVRGDVTADTNNKIITLSGLLSVFLTNLPSLKSFMHGENFECHMPAVSEVQVDNCGLTTIFSCSVLRNSQNLHHLIVFNCRLLADIVEDASADETCDVNDKIITLFKLQDIILGDLPSLRCFSRTPRFSFTMPELYSLQLFGCPHVEYFTCSKTSTSMVRVYTDCHDGEEFPDLNYCIRQNRERKSNSSPES